MLQSYGILFIGILIEGPVVTAAGAFAATLDIFNPWSVLIFSVVGNMFADVICYGIGYWGRETFIRKHGHFLHITPGRVQALEKLYNQHAGKTLLAVKLLPVAATPGLIVAGIARLPIKKFLGWSVLITIPSSVFFFSIGYYTGVAYSSIVHYISYGQYLLVGVTIVFLLLFYGNRKFSTWLSRKIEQV